MFSNPVDGHYTTRKLKKGKKCEAIYLSGSSSGMRQRRVMAEFDRARPLSQGSLPYDYLSLLNHLLYSEPEREGGKRGQERDESRGKRKAGHIYEEIRRGRNDRKEEGESKRW